MEDIIIESLQDKLVNLQKEIKALKSKEKQVKELISKYQNKLEVPLKAESNILDLISPDVSKLTRGAYSEKNPLKPRWSKLTREIIDTNSIVLTRGDIVDLIIAQDESLLDRFTKAQISKAVGSTLRSMKHGRRIAYIDQDGDRYYGLLEWQKDGKFGNNYITELLG